ncbi:MAG: hypothetical protein HY532_04660, partial [Chloroflexi bacterium]|nr:hypothetical protein [Chloroflexota bacterium]
RKGIKVTVGVALLGVVFALISACGGGVSQADYDAAQEQLATREQEAAAAKQQIVSLQQQLQPAEPREPKRLEAKITIDMGEASDGMFFATPEGAKGGPFTLPAGKTVGIHFVNKGEKLHEFMIGRQLMTEDGSAHGYMTPLLEGVPITLFVYYPVSGEMAMVEIEEAQFEEIELDPGAEVWIRAVFPEEMKGEWEIGCFVQEPNEKGHYDQGMHARLIIQ